MVTLKNDFLSLDINGGKWANPGVINIKHLITFSYFKKSEYRDDDVISFNLSGGLNIKWEFRETQEVEKVYEKITELLQSKNVKEEL